jgi:hypothetical protein
MGEGRDSFGPHPNIRRRCGRNNGQRGKLRSLKELEGIEEAGFKRKRAGS